MTHNHPGTAYPVVRKYKQDEKATLEDLRHARRFVASLVEIEPATLPIFLRLDREILDRESKASGLNRARQFAENGIHFG